MIIIKLMQQYYFNTVKIFATNKTENKSKSAVRSRNNFEKSFM